MGQCDREHGCVWQEEVRGSAGTGGPTHTPVTLSHTYTSTWVNCVYLQNNVWCVICTRYDFVHIEVYIYTYFKKLKPCIRA